MRSIYKYNITNTNQGYIEGPIVKLLTTQVQRGEIVLWAEVDTNLPNRKFQILTLGTGWPLDPPANKECVLDTHTYIGTVMLAYDNIVLHVYAAEILPAPVKKPEPPKEKKEKMVAINNAKETTFSGTITMINPDVLKKFIQ